MQHGEYPGEEMLSSQSRVLLYHYEKAPNGFVYVVAETTRPDGPVKIGTTTGNPRKRRGALQTGNWRELQIVDVVPGGLRVEGAIHATLSAERVRLEWFGGDLTRRTVALIHEAAKASVEYFGEHGEMPSEDEVLHSMGIPG
jgi:hypothetical protein